MFDTLRNVLKIRTMRSRSVTCSSYKPEDKVIELAKGRYQAVRVSFRLTHYNEKIYLAFAGDIITSDAKAIARIMKIMWNEALPELPETAELREQLWGTEAEDQAVYFRDMYKYVLGDPNTVFVTVKTAHQIDE